MDFADTDIWQQTFRQQWLKGAGIAEQHREEDQLAFNRFNQLYLESEAPFSRHSFPGHFTASAIVLNKDLTKVLLTHHRKLDKWLQLGGHTDDDGNFARVAFREAEEESGLTKFNFISSPLWQTEISGLAMPFDLDVHEIPPRKSDPLHFHHDARFLLVADDDTPAAIVVSEESHDVKWFSLAEAALLNTERSMLRQFEKVALLKNSSWKLIS